MVQLKRHFIKTISYRIVSTTISFLTMWLITKNIKIGLMFSFTELIFKPIIYFLHERIWYKWIKFGIIKKSP